MKLTHPMSPQELNELIFPSRQFWINGYYGKGAHGLVLSVESLTDHQTYALKVIDARKFTRPDAALREFRIQKLFAKYNMAPRVHLMDVHQTTFRQEPVQFVRVVMDPILCSLEKALITKQVSPKRALAALLCLVQKKFLLRYPTPFLHSDMHCHNIVVLKDKKTLGFIDFGLSVQKPAALQVLDAIPLVMSLREAAARRFPGSEHLLTFSHDVVKMYNKFFYIQLDYERFEKHPLQDGYLYRTTNNAILHSYDWPESARNQRTALPDEAFLAQALPTLRLPVITED